MIITKINELEKRIEELLKDFESCKENMGLQQQLLMIHDNVLKTLVIDKKLFSAKDERH